MKEEKRRVICRMSVTGDLLAVNDEVCRELWRAVDTQEGTVGMLTPKLVLLSRNNQGVRRSEQEARFIYISVLIRAGRYFFPWRRPRRKSNFHQRCRRQPTECIV